MKPEPSKKILIVDDEAHIRLLIQQTLEDLEDEGIEILSADNGTDAIQLAKQAAPQLIFLDVMMPNMDGLQVCQAIRQDLAMKEAYVVILTAKGQSYDRQKSLDAGANRYITKPFDPDELLELANSVLFN
jgi:two-component system alkaline phosphatase synthesis response regulator PhoP